MTPEIEEGAYIAYLSEMQGQMQHLNVLSMCVVSRGDVLSSNYCVRRAR